MILESLLAAEILRREEEGRNAPATADPTHTLTGHVWQGREVDRKLFARDRRASLLLPSLAEKRSVAEWR